MPDLLKRYIRNVTSWPSRKGKAHLLKHLRGGTLTRSEAITAKCYDCVAGEDTQPCTVTTCPLIQFCPWNSAQKS